MKKVIIEIETENAAFDGGEYELARILKEIANKLESGIPVSKIRDINGNTIGSLRVEK